MCRLGSSLTPQDDSELDLGSPEALIPRDEESSEEDRPFLPRFLLQEIILAHSPYEGVFHNRPGLQGNLLCRSDWLRLRGISVAECMILPIRQLVAFPRCSVCEQFKAEERSSARWPLSASALLDDSRWQSGVSGGLLLRPGCGHLLARVGQFRDGFGHGGSPEGGLHKQSLRAAGSVPDPQRKRQRQEEMPREQSQLEPSAPQTHRCMFLSHKDICTSKASGSEHRADDFRGLQWQRDRILDESQQAVHAAELQELLNLDKFGEVVDRPSSQRVQVPQKAQCR